MFAYETNRVEKPKMSPSDTLPPPSMPEDSNIVRIANNLGTFEYDRRLSLHFPSGMVGFPDSSEFGLANLPDSIAQFKLLQSINEQNLSFIVLPCDPASAPIDAEDLDDTAKALNIARENLVLLYVITIRTATPTGGIIMTINQRAPVFVDISRRAARQIVLSNNKYPVQQILG